jgi:hypothetical protein
MGPMTRNEIITTATICGAVVLWIMVGWKGGVGGRTPGLVTRVCACAFADAPAGVLCGRVIASLSSMPRHQLVARSPALPTPFLRPQGDAWGIPAVLAAMLGLSTLLLTGGRRPDYPPGAARPAAH